MSEIASALRSSLGSTRVLCSVPPTLILRVSYPRKKGEKRFGEGNGNHSINKTYNIDTITL